jgi:hypothetical protein
VVTVLRQLPHLAQYWAEEYDWRRVEARLNALPQFITEIDGLDIHFIHVRSKHENALPLIVTHGWPGSIIEQLKIIDPLNGLASKDLSSVPFAPGVRFEGPLMPKLAGRETIVGFLTSIVPFIKGIEINLPNQLQKGMIVARWDNRITNPNRKNVAGRARRTLLHIGAKVVFGCWSLRQSSLVIRRSSQFVRRWRC